MATFESIMLMDGPFDGAVLEGAFGDRIYLDNDCNVVQPAIMQGAGQYNVVQMQHRYRRSLPTYEFHYEGFY